MRPYTRGFTLIEMSIVLVVIGLLVGGVLVGQDMIRAAGVRAQITQIEKYNQAANTFRDKYNALPGDINGNTALSFGFTGNGIRYQFWNMYGLSVAGMGDGNGVIQGVYNPQYPTGGNGYWVVTGEPVLFWADLSSSNLITDPLSGTTSSPMAKIGGSNQVYVYSGGINGGDGTNYYGLSVPTSTYNWLYLYSHEGLTVAQADAIDTKIDDGLPQSGNVTATFLNYVNPQLLVWAGTGGKGGAAYTSATPGSSNTCFDNGNVAGAQQQYSMKQHSGGGVNCALSFRFQ